MKKWITRLCFVFAVLVGFAGQAQAVRASPSLDEGNSRQTVSQLAQQLRVGDVVFINVLPVPFQKVSSSTGTWTNHVGIVIDVSGKDPLIAESTFPFSRITTLSRFTARSGKGRVAIGRLDRTLTDKEREAIVKASEKRLGVRYDTGFNLHSRGQFCSRFVHEVMLEATGTKVGKVETFRELLAKNPQADMTFWRAWYFGFIPWERQTITPASLLQSDRLHTVYDGHAT